MSMEAFCVLLWLRWLNSLQALLLTNLLFGAVMILLILSAPYHSAISQLSSLTCRPLHRLHACSPTQTKLHIFPRRPAHTQFSKRSVSSLPRLTWHFHFTTLCLHSNHLIVSQSPGKWLLTDKPELRATTEKARLTLLTNSRVARAIEARRKTTKTKLICVFTSSILLRVILMK